jgi:hypothetical protein
VFELWRELACSRTEIELLDGIVIVLQNAAKRLDLTQMQPVLQKARKTSEDQEQSTFPVKERYGNISFAG